MKVKDMQRLAEYYGVENYKELSKAELEEKLLEVVRRAWEKQQEELEEHEKAALAEARKGRQEAAASKLATTTTREVPTRVTKSNIMREMCDQGYTVAQIAKELQANYSFVYSVVKKYKEEGAPQRTKKNTKSEQMRRMYDDGKTVAQIAKELNANYAFVYGVIKRYKEQKGETNDNN